MVPSARSQGFRSSHNTSEVRVGIPNAELQGIIIHSRNLIRNIYLYVKASLFLFRFLGVDGNYRRLGISHISFTIRKLHSSYGKQRRLVPCCIHHIQLPIGNSFCRPAFLPLAVYTPCYLKGIEAVLHVVETKFQHCCAVPTRIVCIRGTGAVRIQCPCPVPVQCVQIQLRIVA
ncbi:MAG: hypothetical protein BWY95_01548 [Bacteroidetes bacterium ADurb.BinA104]|nr:MAG: hypothetical protein BWY95_01548 [Bacteroidetes bacterium ADurb.BinA104]